MPPRDPDAQTESRVRSERVRHVSAWLERAGVDNAEARNSIAVDLVDALAGAERAAAALEAMLATDPTTPTGAGEALGHAARVHTCLYTEVKYHLDDMEPLWEPEFEDRLADRVPDEE
jgi:hypothetical protein